MSRELPSVAACLACLFALTTAARAAVTERVVVAGDGKGFVLAASRRPFTPWGLNYGNHGRLIEDYWDSDWGTVEKDFADMKAMGANVVRVHLQFGKFMRSADKPDEKSLDRLARLLSLAERDGLYLDLTGLACYRKADVPAWYDALSGADRWAAQARFWEAVAGRCADSPAVFCYDLMNEPFVPGEKRKAGDWYSGKPFGGYDFIQFITLDRGAASREDLAREWVKALATVVRRRDPGRLVTVGLLPWVPRWGYLSGFVPEKVAPELDFVAVHVYPEKGKVADAVAMLKGFTVGKPLVVEETFPLSCGIDEVEDFIRRSGEFAAGWVGHYDGQTVQELERLKADRKISAGQSLMLDWLRLFRKMAPKDSH